MSIVSYPTSNRNYCIFNDNRISEQKDLTKIQKSLEKPSSEDEVIESLYALNLMLDEGSAKNIENIYPTLAKYNNTSSPNIQTFLAGIYRKTKIPDAFGPLVAMLIQNSIHPHPNCNFDPNEEIGGAILDYLA